MAMQCNTMQQITTLCKKLPKDCKRGARPFFLRAFPVSSCGIPVIEMHPH